MRETVNLPEVEKHQKVRRSAVIAEHLRGMISSGQLKPGDRLPTEEKLCTHLGVSRTTLRESIQMLRVSGILEVTPGRGSFIRSPNLDDMMRDLSLAGQHADIDSLEIDYLVSVLCQEVVMLACRASQGSKRSLHSSVIERDTDAETNEKLESRWHRDIAILAGKEMTARLIEAFLGMKINERLEMFSDRDAIMRLMQLQIRINAAIESCDEEGAARLMKSYTRSGIYGNVNN